MSQNNRVVWSEGLFLRPQHLQQEARFFEAFVNGHNACLQPYGWGFQDFELDRELLSQGKVAVVKAHGLLPDGTPFSIPEDAPAPEPLELDSDTKDSRVYLTLPLRREGQRAVDRGDNRKSLARDQIREIQVRDVTVEGGEQVDMEVGALHLRLLTEADERSSYAELPIALVTEVRADGGVVLSENFIAPSLDCLESPRLKGFITELLGLLHHRGEALAARVGSGGQGGVSEIADFLLLQVVNRYEPVFRHLAERRGLHAEQLFSLLVGIAGEMATFTDERRRAKEFPVYDHDNSMSAFDPVMRALRQSLSMVLEQNAIPLELQERKYGIRVSPIRDRQLVGDAQFILAVKADVAAEQLRSRFPTQVKIGPVEKIRQLVNLQLPGITLRALPVAPRQLPYHAGFTYFELDRSSEFWKPLAESGGFAFHISGDFPGLDLEFWAVRG